jgi:hypothetical protein
MVRLLAIAEKPFQGAFQAPATRKLLREVDHSGQKEQAASDI